MAGLRAAHFVGILLILSGTLLLVSFSFHELMYFIDAGV